MLPKEWVPPQVILFRFLLLLVAHIAFGGASSITSRLLTGKSGRSPVRPVTLQIRPSFPNVCFCRAHGKTDDLRKTIHLALFACLSLQQGFSFSGEATA